MKKSIIFTALAVATTCVQANRFDDVAAGGQPYLGGTFNSQLSSSLGEVHKDLAQNMHGNAHIGYQQPLHENFFIAGEVGPNFANVAYEYKNGNVTKAITEKHGVDAIVKLGVNLADTLLLNVNGGYEYANFALAKDSAINAHGLVVGAGAEYKVSDKIGVGANLQQVRFKSMEAIKDMPTINRAGIDFNWYFQN